MQKQNLALCRHNTRIARRFARVLGQTMAPRGSPKEEKNASRRDQSRAHFRRAREPYTQDQAAGSARADAAGDRKPDVEIVEEEVETDVRGWPARRLRRASRPAGEEVEPTSTLVETEMETESEVERPSPR